MTPHNPTPRTLYTITVDMAQPSLKEKVEAATYIAVRGPKNIGIKHKAVLMWPLTRFHDAAVEVYAAHFLACLHFARLEALPPQVIERIQTVLAERQNDVAEYFELR